MPDMPTVPEIIGIGAPIIDYSVDVSEEFLQTIPGKKAGMELIDHHTLTKILSDTRTPLTPMLGGSSANTVRGLASFGHYGAFIGKVGKDSLGQYFTKGMASFDIKTSYLIPSETPTSQVICLVTPDKERTMRAFLGASKELTVDDLRPDMFTNVKMLHLEGYMLLNQPVAEKAMNLAKDAGAKISFDLGSFEIVESYQDKIVEYLTNYIDIVFANREEVWSLAQLTPEKACAVLSDICDIAVLLLDVEGSMIGYKNQVITVPSHPVKEIMDTTGAGDLFVSGFLHGYLCQESLEECAHYGTQAAAKVIQLKGVEIRPNLNS